MIALLAHLDTVQAATALIAAAATANYLTLPIRTWIRFGPDALEEPPC